MTFDLAGGSCLLRLPVKRGNVNMQARLIPVWTIDILQPIQGQIKAWET